MPNRAERRAQAKRNRRGVPQQYDQTQGRARSGMLDEYQLQEKSRRLQDGTDGPWKPSASTITETENVLNTNPDYKNPKMFKAPHSVRQWFRVASWVLIALSAIAFLVAASGITIAGVGSAFWGLVAGLVGEFLDCASSAFGLRATRASTHRQYGALAQLVERLLCKQDVNGSNPLGSTITLRSDLIGKLLAFPSNRTPLLRKHLHRSER